MIYVDFERILVLEDNTKKNLDECCTKTNIKSMLLVVTVIN